MRRRQSTVVPPGNPRWLPPVPYRFDERAMNHFFGVRLTSLYGCVVRSLQTVAARPYRKITVRALVTVLIPAYSTPHGGCHEQTIGNRPSDRRAARRKRVRFEQSERGGANDTRGEHGAASGRSRELLQRAPDRHWDHATRSLK